MLLRSDNDVKTAFDAILDELRVSRVTPLGVASMRQRREHQVEFVKQMLHIWHANGYVEAELLNTLNEVLRRVKA